MRHLVFILSFLMSFNIFAADFSQNQYGDEAKMAICIYVGNVYSIYMSKEDCLGYEIKESQSEKGKLELTLPFCGEVKQFVQFTYDPENTEIQEGSSGSISSEECGE